MSTIKDLFGSSEEESDGSSFDQEAFDREWAQAEQEHETMLAERIRIEIEQEIQDWKLTVASQYQKHPPRAIGAEKRANNLCVDYYYSFHDTYPILFQVATSRVQCALQRDSEHTQELLRNSRKIGKLPCSALEYYALDVEKNETLRYEWTPQLKTILAGVREKPNRKRSRDGDADNCLEYDLPPLTVLRDHETTLVPYIISFLSSYGHHVTMTLPASLVMNIQGKRRNRYNLGHSGQRPFVCKIWENLTSNNKSYAKGSGYVAFTKVAQVLDLFPSPEGRNVNMMPFILGDRESLPDDLQCYYPLIDACPFMHDEFGKVAFLTVQESDIVKKDKTQRRPGIHIESPGVFADDKIGDPSVSFTPGAEMHHWGNGSFGGPDRYEGGIYLASNLEDSVALWDALVDSSIPGIVDRHGGVNQLKRFFPDHHATKLRAGELVWMTDCTPHEALPQQTAGPRTFFRLVMPCVTHWYAEHSTPNPKVPIPANISVVQDCKFAAAERTKVS